MLKLMDLKNYIFFILLTMYKAHQLGPAWKVRVEVIRLNMSRGNNSDTVIYSISFKHQSVLPSRHLLVSPNQPVSSSLSDNQEVDYCNDGQRAVFLAIERSTNTILTGLWIKDDKTHFCLECTASMCNLSHFDVYSNSISNNFEETFRKQRSLTENSSSILEITEPMNRIFHVSVLMIIDYATVQAHCMHWPECCVNVSSKTRFCHRIRSYYRNMMAAGRQLYASIDTTQMQIKLYLAELVLLPDVDGKSYFDELILNGTDMEIDAYLALVKCSKILQDTQFSRRIRKKYAAAVFFVRHHLRRKETGYNNGIAFTASVCRKAGVALVRETFAYTRFFTFLHELSHTLGAEHDDVYEHCGPTDRLMAANPYRSDLSKRFLFSCCSLISMYNYLKSATCVSSPPLDSVNISNINPNLGEQIARSEYCSLAHGKGYQPCYMYDSECNHIYCTIDNLTCEASSVPAYNGMSCSTDNSKWCMHGHCVQKENFSFQDQAQRECNVTRDIKEIRKTEPPNTKKVMYSSGMGDRPHTEQATHVTKGIQQANNVSQVSTAIHSTHTQDHPTEQTELTKSTTNSSSNRGGNSTKVRKTSKRTRNPAIPANISTPLTTQKESKESVGSNIRVSVMAVSTVLAVVGVILIIISLLARKRRLLSRDIAST